MTTDLTALRDLALGQGGLVTRDQASSVGLSSGVIRRAVAAGRLRTHLGCLVVPSVDASRDVQDAWALGLRLGPESVVTGPTALRLRGWHIPDTQLVVAVRPHRHVRLVGAVVLRDVTPRLSVAAVGYRLAGRVDALLDTVLVVTQRRAEEIIDIALQRHWLDATSWDAATRHRFGRGRTGATRLRMLGERVLEDTHSDGERRLWLLMKRAGLSGWVPNHPLRDAQGRIVAELDVAHPALRVCIEVDGWAAHSGADAFEQDRSRQNALVIAGWLVLRFTWHQIVHEPDYVIAQIQAALHLRATGGVPGGQ